MQCLHGAIFIIDFAAAILDFWVELEWKQIRRFVAQPYLGAVAMAFPLTPSGLEMEAKR
jgi:hypothetical protein